MNQATMLFNQAELALATYATLGNGIINTEAQRAALRDVGFSKKEAEEFVKRYTEVVTQFSDTATSFSATVFSDSSGNLTQ